MAKRADFIWMDRKFILWQDAKVHVMAHGLHYGTDVFEGINLYKCKNGKSAIFKLDQHLRRLIRSVAIMGFYEIPFSLSEMREATIEIVKKNNFEEAYIRPLVIVGTGGIGPLPYGNPIHLAIILTEPITGYFGKDVFEEGISLKVSSWKRDNSVMPFAAKVAGNYINSALAKLEAKRCGFDEPLVLDAKGHVDEGSAANVFIVRDGKLITPPPEMPILKGITRDTVITLGRDELYLKVEEMPFGLEDFYAADEAFFCGTAAEISPIREIEDRRIGKECPGPTTRKIHDFYSRATRGELSKYEGWLTYID